MFVPGLQAFLWMATCKKKRGGGKRPSSLWEMINQGERDGEVEVKDERASESSCHRNRQPLYSNLPSVSLYPPNRSLWEVVIIPTWRQTRSLRVREGKWFRQVCLPRSRLHGSQIKSKHVCKESKGKFGVAAQAWGGRYLGGRGGRPRVPGQFELYTETQSQKQNKEMGREGTP